MKNINKTSLLAQLYRVFVREFRVVFRDQGLVIFFLFLPIAYPIIYSLIYNPELVRDVPLVIVDHDRTQLSREFARKMDATQEVWVKGYAADIPEARRALAGRDCFAILEIPKDFERNTVRLEQANVILYTDMTLMLRYKSFLMAATNVSQEMGAEIQQKNLNTDLPVSISVNDPMPVKNISMGDITGGFDSFVMPGVLVLILHQCIILAIGMAGGAKREPRRLLGYVSYNEESSVLMTMLGQMLCFITIMIVPMIFLIHYVPMIFAFPMAGNTWQIFAFLFPMVIACICMGYCFQCIVLERESVFVLWVITSVIFLFLSGLTWPRFAMPPFWKGVSDCIPATWGVEGFIRMNSNGASLSQVSTEYIALWILAGVFFVLAYILQRFVMRPIVRARYPLTPAEQQTIEDS